MKKLLIVCALAAAPLAHAAFYSGYLLQDGLKGQNLADNSRALGYIAGVADSYMGVKVCTNGKVNLGQAADIVQSYLSSNPKMRHYTADSLVVAALATAFPCPSK